MFQGNQNTRVKSEKRSDGVGGKVGCRKEKKKDFSFYVVANDASIQVEFLLFPFFLFVF